jgi:uncharacterized protein with von Willebrand factor type A (vWA) domain
MQRALLEFVAVVRRSGVRVSTAEALDAARALSCVPLACRADLRLALASTLAKTAGDRQRVLDCFDRFFLASGSTQLDLYARLRAQGFSEDELESLRGLLEASARQSPAGPVLRALTQGAPAFDQLLELSARALFARTAPDLAQLSFLSMRLLERARVPRAATDLGVLRTALRGALGSRGESMADALAEELRAFEQRAREHVKQRVHAPPDLPLEQRPFESLLPGERAQVEAAVRELAQRLLGRAAVRARHQRRGRIDVRRTMRLALATRGTPIRLRFRKHTPRRPRLVMLCDVSDSMHASARFMLLFVHAAQRLFRDARSFVFVSDVADASELFRRQSAERAIELAYRGAIVSVADNSHYARAFEQMLTQHASVLDRQSTLLILGDARSNHFSPGLPALRELTSRVHRTLWFTPEPESAWALSDSALPQYAPELDQVFSVNDLTGLRRAARALVRF